MKTFLDELADDLIAAHGSDFSEVAIVLPSKRASLFLKKSLAKKLKTTFWSPLTYTFTDLVELFCHQVILDKTSIAFELYEVYLNSDNKENKETFDQFYKWGELLLSDFNDIDLYLLDSKEVFRDLRNIKELEGWGNEDLTDMQLRYLGFWNQLKSLYEALQKHLEAKNFTYAGAAYKHAAQRVNDVDINELPFKFIWFAGLNALSASETAIIDHFVKEKTGRIKWDLDSYYIDDELHEAGFFYRKIAQNFERLAAQTVPSNMNQLESITFYQSNSAVGQARIAAQVVKEIAPIINYEKCAVILPDPNLLHPVINELPSEIEAANITMGFPTEKSEIYSLFVHLISLQANIQKNRKTYGHANFHFQPLFRILQHPVLRKYHQEEFEQLENSIKRFNKVYISKGYLEKFDWFKQLEACFTEWKNYETDGINALTQAIDFVKKLLLGDESDQSINMELLFNINASKNRLQNMLETYPYIEKLSTFKRLFLNMVRNNQVSFFGEPLSGLQIMGLLETRALDFENIIILSVNEGILPGARPDQSILPFDLKQYHQLPSTYEKDAVLAYHFYRLIQRAKNVHIVYAPLTDDLGAGEKSRFILQLEQEFNPEKLAHRKFKTELGIKQPEIAIEKDDLYLSKLNDYLLNSGLSISALNKYVRCPLDFYYAYICGLSEESEVEEDIEASTLGSIIHLVLENIYKPFIGKWLEIDQLLEAKKSISKQVEDGFNSALGSKDFYGKNYLAKEMALLQINHVVDSDIASVKAKNKIKVLGLEDQLSHSLLVDGKRIKLMGMADRIDQFNGTIRIIDYKTGSVDKTKLKFNLDVGFRDTDDKAAQLAYYAYLYQQKHPDNTLPIESVIFAVRNKIQLVNHGSTTIKQTPYNEEFNQQFEMLLIDRITEMYNLDRPLTHTTGAKYCKVC